MLRALAIRQRLHTGGLDPGTNRVPLGQTVCAGTSAPVPGFVRGAVSDGVGMWHVLLMVIQRLPQGMPFLPFAVSADGTS